MIKNIKLSYLLVFLFNSWFWIATWILYYLRFTDYAGIGILESIMITISFVAEIPTGAVSDLLGKKRTLFLAFFLNGIGNFIMGIAPSYSILIVSLFFMVIGFALQTGTMEALVFDSLKEKKKEKLFDIIVSRHQSISLIAWTISSLIGGFIYKINPSLTYYFTGSMLLLGSGLTLLLSEPSIDTYKFSWINYKKQLIMGFKELFKTPYIKKQSLFIIITGFFTVITYEILADALRISLGFDSIQLGFLISVGYLVAALISYLSPTYLRKIGYRKSLFSLLIIISVIFIFSPNFSFYIGIIMSLILSIAQTLIKNSRSVLINQATQSQYRATTISTLEMIKSTPYVLLAFMIGKLIDQFGAAHFAFYLGILMLVLVCITGFPLLNSNRK